MAAEAESIPGAIEVLYAEIREDTAEGIEGERDERLKQADVAGEKIRQAYQKADAAIEEFRAILDAERDAAWLDPYYYRIQPLVDPAGRLTIARREITDFFAARAEKARRKPRERSDVTTPFRLPEDHGFPRPVKPGESPREKRTVTIDAKPDHSDDDPAKRRAKEMVPESLRGVQAPNFTL